MNPNFDKAAELLIFGLGINNTQMHIIGTLFNIPQIGGLELLTDRGGKTRIATLTPISQQLNEDTPITLGGVVGPDYYSPYRVQELIAE